MGAYSPAPVLDDAMLARAMDEIVRPAVSAMAAEGTPFRGVLYAGLMITEAGPQLLEFNVRFGDPECQVLVPRLKSDLLPALMATRDGGTRQFRSALARPRRRVRRDVGERLPRPLRKGR